MSVNQYFQLKKMITINNKLIVLIKIVVFVVVFLNNSLQQTYHEQSKIDVFRNKSPIFNYMPNVGHIDLERLNYYREHVDLREEEGDRINLFN